MVENPIHSEGKKAEWFAFLFLAVLLAPAVAVAGIGGYGLLV